MVTSAAFALVSAFSYSASRSIAFCSDDPRAEVVAQSPDVRRLWLESRQPAQCPPSPEEFRRHQSDAAADRAPQRPSKGHSIPFGSKLTRPSWGGPGAFLATTDLEGTPTVPIIMQFIV